MLTLSQLLPIRRMPGPAPSRNLVAALCCAVCAMAGCQDPAQRHTASPAGAERTAAADLSTSAAHPQFSESRVAALKPGLSSTQIETLFGAPDNRTTTELGVESSDPWTAVVYTYDMSPADAGATRSNTLVFDMAYDPPLLDHFNIATSYVDAQVPAFATVPEGITVGLPGFPDAVNAACAVALETLGTTSAYAIAQDIDYWRYGRPRVAAHDMMRRTADFITGASTDKWHTRTNSALKQCFAAIIEHTYDQSPSDDFSRMSAADIPEWVRSECQGRWWAETPDSAIRERIAAFEALRNGGAGYDDGLADMNARCAELQPPEGLGDVKQIKPWAGCTHCDTAVVNYVFGVWPTDAGQMSTWIRETCHDATIALDDHNAQSMINAVMAAVEVDKQAGTSKVAALTRGAVAQPAVLQRAPQLDAAPPDDLNQDPRTARVRRRALLLQCGNSAIEYVYR